MRINEPNRASLINAYNKTNKVQPAKEVKNKMGKDEVQISNAGMELLRMGEELETSATKKARLEELKQQIEKGTYQVSSEKIADKFLSFWQKP